MLAKLRWIWIPVAVTALALAAAGCGSSDDETAPATTGSSTTTTAPKLKVGLITDVGQLNDDGFNELAYNGLKRRSGSSGSRAASSSRTPPPTTSRTWRRSSRQGYDLIIGVGFVQGAAIDKAAVRFPKTHFAIVDVDQTSLTHKPKNVVGLLFKEQEVGYLVGYLAALSAKREGSNAISAVGGYKEPPVDRYIAGYRAGAEKAVPGTKVTWGYSSDWDDQAKCKELALNQIAAGSKVVFQVAGGCGLGALNAAKERDVWGIGVDADQSFLGKHVLTSALKGVDAAVFETIKAVQDGSFPGGTNSVFGLDQDGVGLGKVSPDANRADVRKLDRIEKELADGEITGIPTKL